MKLARFEFACVRPSEEAAIRCTGYPIRRGGLGSCVIQSRQNSTIQHMKDGS
jgi:hypothetical protein